jgi:hypothetical protein
MFGEQTKITYVQQTNKTLSPLYQGKKEEKKGQSSTQFKKHTQETKKQSDSRIDRTADWFS